MALFFTVTLIISIVGIVGILALKRWELSTGHMIGGSARPKVGGWMNRMLAWVEHALPGLARQWAQDGYRYTRVMVHRLAALSVLLAERGLEKILKLLRHKTSLPRSDMEASAFLREVSAHKKQLLKSTRIQRSMYEE